MDWKHGYHANDGYTYGYYPETMPARLQWAALIQGHVTPTRKFRYLDAGCGQGLNLILAAAAHPDSEFVGLDFMPNHIAHARELAKRCGLSNVQFIEADFLEIVRDEQAWRRLGEFDYTVCHGISTWVSRDVKEALFKLVGRTLKPGGVFYNAYNTHPGWLTVVPFQHLVLLEQDRQSGEDAINAAQETIRKISECTKFLDAFPGMKGRLESFKTQEASYLVQEYNNLSWQPVFVSQMIDELAMEKLDYLGTATLVETYVEGLPPALRQLIDQQPTQKLKLQVHDYGINQSFRRDLYVKGRHAAWPAELTQKILDARFMVNKAVKRPLEGESYTFSAGTIKIDGKAEAYSALLDQLSDDDGLSLQEIKIPNQVFSANSISKMLSLLLHGGWALPLLSNDTNSVSVNKAICDAVCMGAPYRYLSLGNTGSAFMFNQIELMTICAYLRKIPENEWALFVRQKLGALGQSLAKDGKKLTDQNDSESLLQEQINQIKPKIQWLKSIRAI